MSIELRDWQVRVYREAKHQLKLNHQAAMELFTSGGKTYIAGKIIEDYIDNDNKANILWVSSRSAIDNVASGYFSESLHKHITFATFGDIERYGIDVENNVKTTFHKKYSLIIIDEAHRALAPHAFYGIGKLRDIHFDADLLVMTATPKRYSDGRNAFAELTPLAKPCGIPLKAAVKGKLVTDMQYRVCNTQVLKQDYFAIEEYRKVSEKYGIFRTQINVLEHYLENFQFNLKESAVRVLKENNPYDGTKGDRWMVFFSTVLALKSMKPDMEEVFHEVYPGKAVRVLEYHGRNTKDINNNVLSIMTEPATPGTVDVILTVEKGGESVHPKNMRGILMYRCTRSDRIYQQQLGRAVRIKDNNEDGPAVIIDFVNNVSIVGGDTLGVGYRALSDRPDKDHRIPSIDEITSRIERIDDGNKLINVKIGDPMLAEYLEVSQAMREIMPWMVTWDKISTLMERAPKYQSVFDMLSRADTPYDPSERRILKRWFRDNQQKYMAGDFDEMYPDKKAYFDIAGCYAYMTKDMSDKAKKRIKVLEKVAELLEEVDYDYSRLDEVKGLRDTINKFRSLYAGEKLESSEVIYCRRNGIDVELKEELTDDDIANLLKHRNSSRLVRMYLSVSNNIKSKRKENKDITYDDFIDIHSALLSFKRAESRTLGIALHTKLSRECAGELKLYQIDPSDMSEAMDMLTVIDKAKNDSPLTIFDEDLIFRGVDDFDEAFSEFTRRMLSIHGISKYNYSRRLTSKTQWMRSYQRVIADKDPSAYAKMKQYNPESIPAKMRKMERGKKFREVEASMGQTIHSEIVKNLVNMAYTPNVSVLNDLSSRIKDGFPLARLLAYAFPEHTEKSAYKAFSQEELSDKDIQAIEGVIKSTAYATKYILKTIRDSGIVDGTAEYEVLADILEAVK